MIFETPTWKTSPFSIIWILFVIFFTIPNRGWNCDGWFETNLGKKEYFFGSSPKRSRSGNNWAHLPLNRIIRTTFQVWAKILRRFGWKYFLIIPQYVANNRSAVSRSGFADYIKPTTARWICSVFVKTHLVQSHSDWL